MTNYTQLDQYSEELHEQVKLFNGQRIAQKEHWIEQLEKPSVVRWGCAMIIKNEKGEILLGRRSQFCNEPGTWGFPGGLVENFQQPDDAVIRETLEETNLMVWEMKLVALEGNDVREMNFIYEASVKKCSGLMKRQASEVDKLEWVNPKKMEFHTLFEASQVTWDTYTGKNELPVDKVFCSGHRDITQREFDLQYKYQLDQTLALAEIKSSKVEIFVGNWEGADLMIQAYFEDWYAESGYTKDITDLVTVNICAVQGSDIDNISGYFNILRGYYDWADADGFMTRNTDRDVTWVRKGKEDSGSAQNIQRRIDYNNSLELKPNFKR